jgi:hypothetical protein
VEAVEELNLQALVLHREALDPQAAFFLRSADRVPGDKALCRLLPSICSPPKLCCYLDVHC